MRILASTPPPFGPGGLSPEKLPSVSFATQTYVLISLTKVMLTVAPAATDVRLKNAHAGAVAGAAVPTVTIAAPHATKRETNLGERSC